jgi:hypothetical protein
MIFFYKRVTMITPKTTAMVVALAAIGVFGALATIGNQAVFAQVTNTNTNSQSQSATLTCNANEADAGNNNAVQTCTITQEMGNCQVGVGGTNGAEVSSTFESDDCS